MSARELVKQLAIRLISKYQTRQAFEVTGTPIPLTLATARMTTRQRYQTPGQQQD